MEYKTLSLREAANFDHQNSLKQMLTGWGKICKDREGKPFTRKMRVLRNKENG